MTAKIGIVAFTIIAIVGMLVMQKDPATGVRVDPMALTHEVETREWRAQKEICENVDLGLDSYACTSVVRGWRIIDYRTRQCVKPELGCGG